MIEYALLTAVLGIADEIKIAKLAKNPSPEQLRMRARWAKYKQIQGDFKNKLAEFDKSLASKQGKE